VNPEKTKYMLMSRSQKLGEKHSTNFANKSFEDVAKFRYLGTTLTDEICVYEEINSRLSSANACTVRFRVFCPPACCLRT
jgi:hypothetical protein